MSFVVRKPGAGAVVLDDLGITVTGLAASERDLRDLEAADISASADLAAAISGGTLVVLDPRDDSTALSLTDGELARITANDAHFGVAGGRFGNLDSPGTVVTDDYIVQYNQTSNEFEQIPVSTALIGSQSTIGAIVGAMGQDGTDTTFVFNPANSFILPTQDETNYDGTGINGSFVGGDGAGGTAYVALDTITLSDGTIITVDAVDANGDVTQFTVTTSGGTPVATGVALTQTSTSGTGTLFTLTPESANVTAGSLQWDTDDVFLRNSGDTLDSGTLTVASGATIAIATGGELTIADLPVNPQDAANKEYVDSVAAGLDPKESVRYCTVLDVSGSYAAGGGTAGTGAFTSVDFTSVAIFDGLTAGAIQVGDRILVKSQINLAGTAAAAVSGAPAGSVVPGIVAATYDLDVTIDGGGLQQLSITTAGGEDYDAIAALMSTVVTGGSVAFVAGSFLVTSASLGSSSSVIVAAGTAGSGGGDVFAAIDLAATVTTTFPAPVAGTDGALENGIYSVTTNGATGAMERASDHDGTPANEVSGGNFTFVENGTACANTGWVLTGDGILTLNTDPIIFVQFSESTNINAGVGLSQGGQDIDLDINDTLGTTNAVDGGDLVAFHDQNGAAAGSGSGSQTYARTFDAIMADLDIVNYSGGNGILVKTGDDTYINRSIAVDGLGPLDGLAVVNGDGVSGNPTVGLDIQSLPVQTTIDTALDRVAVWDSSANANVYYTVGDISGALASVNSFETWAGAGNTTGDASIVADTATDTVTLTGGVGINVDFTAASDTLTFTFTRAGMSDTAVVSADTVPFFDASNANAPEFRSWANIIVDLGLATLAFTTISGDSGSAIADTASDTLNLVGAANGGITTVASDAPETVTFGITPVDLTTGAATLTTADFIIVSDSADTATTVALKYTFGDVIADLGLITSISASADEDLLGINVTGTVVGLDIVGLTDPGADMAATDEFPLHDKSEGTGGANRKITGQNIADGVVNILNIATLTFDTFIGVTTPADDQTLLAYTDATRANKVLSVESQTYQFSERRVARNDWVSIGNASDALSGWVMPLDGTVVMATAHTEDANGNTYDLDLYIDAVDSGPIANLAGAGEASDSDPTLDLDFTAGQKLRIRGDRTAGTGALGDTTISITVRWRS